MHCDILLAFRNRLTFQAAIAAAEERARLAEEDGEEGRKTVEAEAEGVRKKARDEVERFREESAMALEEERSKAAREVGRCWCPVYIR